MSRQRYTEKFKIEAVKQVTERGHPVIEVDARLGMPSLLSKGSRTMTFKLRTGV